ncbi:FecCD family ABC transporter permease [Salinicoccus hispanicus]|uniref:Probable heme-iron transport system permease protein IsdF n=1 Tax=Salinicoccus hispanicus TaxID=157225 RepID=A0A6N8U1L0_9STAP|nr:iron ABC transporter permease [Salinicoccus hispanicus]MXQ51247.1 iron chelate uptake ABC transporter family permease subunit [Salinicoccus hispanicus]
MRNQAKFIIIIALLSAIVLTHLFTGTFSLTWTDLLNILANQANDDVRLVLFEFRLPRILVVLVCGAALALSGLILQVISKNPLADPGIIGVNAGSGFGVVLFITFISSSMSQHLYALPLMSFVGGLLTVLIIFFLSFIGGAFKSNIFILIGIATAMGVTGFVYVFTSVFDETQMEMLNRYFAGNIWGDTWPFVYISVPYILLISLFVFFRIREMGMLNLDDEMLTGFGMNVNKEKIILIILSAMLSSLAVSVCGAISFIGLIAPHISRMLFGQNMRVLFFSSILIGSVLLTAADLLGKLLLAPAIIPTGIVVALIGGPYFLWLLMRARQI